MKLKLLIFVLFLSLNSFSQGEASNWFFGNKAGIKFNADNSITVLSVNPNPIAINTNEGCSSLSDPNGNLLFYTDGRTVWDRNHLIMPNGNYMAGLGLLGDPSSTQSGVIIPNPANPNIYYLFTVDEPHQTNASVYPNQYTGTYTEPNGQIQGIPEADDGFNNGLNYSIIDMSIVGSNGSIGDVAVRNNPLVTYDPNPFGEEIKYKCSEKVTAVKVENGLGYWVITHFTNKFYAFKIDENGVNETPVITQINPMVPVSGYRRNAIGQIKASPNGKKVAIAHNQLSVETAATEANGAVYLYDFDNETGIISNGIRLMENVNPYGVEFSAETKKLYITTASALTQFNLENTPIIASETIISNRGNASLQLGPDKKIYKANINTDNDATLDVINNPELDGNLCNFQQEAVALGAGISRFGLPHFITSTFSSTITARNLCLGDTTLFEVAANGTIDSVEWDFGDGSPTTNSVSPNHVYNSTGEFIVSVTLVVGGNIINESKEIVISALPQAFPSSLVQCSPSSSETNILFNLSQANNEITGNDSSLIVSFYKLASDATNGVNQLPTNYSNISNPEQIVVKVTNPASGCYTLTTLDLIVNPSNNPEIIIRKCDDPNEDGITQFQLSDATINGFSATATTLYYATLDDAFLEINPINISFTNTTADAQIVYARVEENNECLGIFSIQLIVEPLPQLKTTDISDICTNITDQTITLTAGLLQGNLSNFNFQWSTGQSTPSIQVNLPGTYSVQVTNSLGCAKSQTFTVLPSNNATILNVIITDLVENNTVTILLDAQSIGDYLYSLDDPNGPFQESNHFENVASGFHTVYVYSTKGCGTTPQNISVLEVPKFFTPNQDGVNDTWNIVGINALFYANSKIYVFDRFGKLLADINPKGPGWNGIYNGQNLPSTDYWYVLTLDNGRIVRGHFSLVR
jgi:gliding motility-associated-like protein